ncbi:MAG: hypothetical protein CM1200mP2_58500 [Planctomycetaceae bacterium]|nr:MAG: hypothetical protein CM1200mP2_58500 [Planctomycetaceae bacterium]
MHTAVVLSRPHSKPEVYDAIIAGYVNGRKQKVEENDKQYYFAGPLPPPLKGDGKYASFDVPVPPEAKFLTLGTTGADHPADNPINSDHSVFSGARLEMTPVPQAILARARKAKGRKSGDKTTEKQDRADAVLLSEHLFDQGLLALPAGDAAGILPKPAAAGSRSGGTVSRFSRRPPTRSRSTSPHAGRFRWQGPSRSIAPVTPPAWAPSHLAPSRPS